MTGLANVVSLVLLSAAPVYLMYGRFSSTRISRH